MSPITPTQVTKGKRAIRNEILLPNFDRKFHMEFTELCLQYLIYFLFIIFFISMPIVNF